MYIYQTLHVRDASNLIPLQLLYSVDGERPHRRRRCMGGCMDREARGAWPPRALTNRDVPSRRRSAGRQAASLLPTRRFAGMSLTAGESSSGFGRRGGERRKSRFGYIPDHFNTLEQVTNALREAGLESSNLILGIDFTKSNEWTGKHSFNNRCLHAIGAELNPYEKVITVIGKTLAPFDEDNLIPCFGFGDLTTHDKGVFSFNSNGIPCRGFKEVLARYREIAPKVILSGPTSFGPVVEVAMDIVEQSEGQFHVLVIIADGQVTRSVNTADGDLSIQERETIDAIVRASSYALSIVLVGVGDGPWEDMKKFDDRIPKRRFDNFQFVNFTSIMEKTASSEEKDALFALSALMEIPFQYKAMIEINLLSQKTGKARIVLPRPPPGQAITREPPRRQLTRDGNIASSALSNGRPPVCPICLDKAQDLAFGCGHLTCRECGQRISDCPICRQRIASRLRLYTG